MEGSIVQHRLAQAAFLSLAGMAVAAVAVWLRMAIEPLVGTTSPYLTVYPAVMFVGFYLGIGPGILASLLGILLTEAYVVHPAGELLIEISDWGRAGIVFFSAVFLGYAGHRVQRAYRRISEILESITDGFVSVDTDWCFTYVNHEAERLLDRSRDQLLGEPVWDAFAETEGGVLRERLQQALEKQQSAQFEVFYPSSGAWHAIHVYPGRSSLSVYFRDISSKKVAEEALRAGEERYRCIVETANEGVWIIDQENRTSYANAKMASMLGYALDEMPEKSLFDFVDLEGQHSAQENLERRRTGIAEQHEFRFKRKDGTDLWALVSTNPIHNDAGQYLGALGMVTDITERKLAEERLETALQTAEVERRRLAAVLEALPAGVAIADVNGKVTHFNAALTRIWGNPPIPESADEYREWRGRWADTGESLGVDDWAMVRALRTGEVVPGDVIEIEKFDGSGSATIINAAAPIRDQEGRIVAAALAEIDITAQREAEKALRESERRFREVLESSLDAAYRRNLQTDTYDYVSPVVRQVFHIEPEAFRSMSLAEFLKRIHPDDHESVGRAVDEGTVTGSGRVEYRFRGDDGHYRWLADHFTVQKDAAGRPISRGGIVREITELRKAQEALEESDRRKDEFLAMLGHELRNPLAAITTGLQLLQSRDTDDRQWVVDSMERQTRQLVRLVDDLLDISRITRGKIQLRSEIVDLGSVIHRAAESTDDLMGEKRHTFTISAPQRRICVFGDPARLQQVVVNLLNNAAKYTSEDGRIDLRLTCEQDMAVVRIRDNGLGIPLDMQESIFELFGQVDSAIHRPQQGLGIGLNLVKSLVELHQGSVVVKSDGPETGSEFIVRLPLVEAPADFDERSGPETSDGAPLDILVVEDNRETARMLCTVLTEKGHRIRHADNGLRALELAAQHQPDLVILDIGLPGMSGYEVAEALRQDLRYGDTLIIAATGYGQEKDRSRSRQAGIDHHLVKPVEYPTLALLMREWQRTADRHRFASRTASEQPPAERSRSTRILVIDDMPVIAQMTQQMLEDLGYPTEIALDGASGIEIAKRFRPDLILCDVSMPVVNGYDVLRALKEEPALRHAVVVAVTGHAEEEDKQRTAQAGFHGHLVKPVDRESLESLLGQLPDLAGE